MISKMKSLLRICAKSKKTLFFIGILFLFGCKKENSNLNQIVGKWQLVKGYDLSWGGDYLIAIEDQRIAEYTKNNEKILYDYLGNETARLGFNITDSTIIVFGVSEWTGNYWELESKYWFKQDTLVINNFCCFESHDEFFVRIE